MDVATVHLVSDHDANWVLDSARTTLSSHGLDHATVQVERTVDERKCEEDVTW